MSARVRLTYVGGPTARIELGGVACLTDPTFDPAGRAYPTPSYVLRKTQSAALDPGELGAIDAVLLSHDHHFDNLDDLGRAYLARAPRVLTTVAGAERLGGRAEGFAPWAETDVVARDGSVVRVVATPARHGPDGGDRGPCVGFVLAPRDRSDACVYVSGDTVWYEGVAEVARRFDVRVAMLFMGAARVAAAGPAALTFTAEEGVAAARAFAGATIVPLHYEGWEHFTESRADVERAFRAAGIESRLRWLAPGVPTELALA